jgi:hypothetical protein
MTLEGDDVAERHEEGVERRLDSNGADRGHLAGRRAIERPLDDLSVPEVGKLRGREFQILLYSADCGVDGDRRDLEGPKHREREHDRC